MGKQTHIVTVRQRRKRREERIKARILALKAQAAKSRPTSAS
jgi:hypothetical protein